MIQGLNRRTLATGAAAIAIAISWAGSAAAQTAPESTPPATANQDPANRDILVTGSRIRRDPNDSALPLQIIDTRELTREGISSPEQFISYLSTNGNGADNLASNADVVSTAAQRGTNGLSAANLRGQGTGGTLVLLNGRRVAAHGLSGSAVDVNQIPLAAIERIEVLKDGASAIYGTDAIGGVINYITRTDFQGVELGAFTDFTQRGDGNIYRLSGIAGWGDLDDNGFNVMGAVSYRWNTILRGDSRDFVNGNQPDRGLSIDTRGTPIATAFPLNPSSVFFPQGTLFGGTTGGTLLAGLVVPGTATRATGGINYLDFPGQAGCESMPGGMAYDIGIWPGTGVAGTYACAWDTSRAVVLQQPLQTLTYYGRATARIAGEHDLFFEITGSRAEAAKLFSNPQISSNTTSTTAALPVAYPLNALTASTYNTIYDLYASVFPAIGAVGDRTVDAVGNYGRPIGFRWRCLACGNREYNTTTTTFRIATGMDGPLWQGWDYRFGASYARSESSSVLGSGYYYRGTLGNGAIDPRVPIAPGATAPGFVGLLNAGILNPFSLTQTDQALAGLEAVSARGARLYGGEYQVKQADLSISGGLFDIWGGTVQMAVGVDWRRETYNINGRTEDALGPTILLAAFDPDNSLDERARTVRAAYAEILFPILDNLELTLAGRIDDYTGFGTTTNPKVSMRYRPFQPVMFRGSYNTGFRVPSFAQVFYGRTPQTTASGAGIVDPFRCPTLQASTTDPNCVAITPDRIVGGNPNVGPETAEQLSFGVVIEPAPRFSLAVDWWMINVDDIIWEPNITQLLQNAQYFPERFIRDPATNEITDIDLTFLNAGSRRTQGIEVSFRGGVDAFGGALSFGMDGTYLLRKRQRIVPATPYVDQVGLYTLSGDLGLRWKHSAFVTWTNDAWTVSLSQLFRLGYTNQVLDGVGRNPPTATPSNLDTRVNDYVLYNLSIGYNIDDRYSLTFGVRNLFDTDPPFAVTYDTNTGAGGSWEPRVADPRGRSFTVSLTTRL